MSTSNHITQQIADVLERRGLAVEWLSETQVISSCPLPNDGGEMNVSMSRRGLALNCECEPSAVLAVLGLMGLYPMLQGNYPALPDDDTRTDAHNAERLIRAHGRDLRYVPDWVSWLVWDGCRWQVDRHGAVTERAKTVQAAIYREAAEAADAGNRPKADRLAAWARQSGSASRIREMVNLAKSTPGVPVDSRELDADLWLLNFPNGTLDLRSGDLRPHSRSDLITKCVPTPYDPAAQAPKFHRFLDRVQPDPDVQEFLRRSLGYSLTGDTGERVAFFLHGIGANGKSLLLETMYDALGEDYAHHIDTKSLMARKNGSAINNDIARLAGVRFVYASESDAGERLNEAAIKNLTGGDTVTARFLHKEFFDFRPAFKVFFATNHKPRVSGDDVAMWDRLRLVPFDVRIPEAERDKTLRRQFADEERAGIIAWAVGGCVAWRDGGLTMPHVVAQATVAYRAENDDLSRFLSERCTLTAGARLTKEELYAAYVAWCSDNDETPFAKNEFGRRLLAEDGVTEKRTKKARCWVGLALRPAGGDTGDADDTDSDVLPIDPSLRERNQETASPASPCHLDAGPAQQNLYGHTTFADLMRIADAHADSDEAA